MSLRNQTNGWSRQQAAIAAGETRCSNTPYTNFFNRTTAKEKDIVEAMKALKPDVLVMIAFGQILKKDVLENGFKWCD